MVRPIFKSQREREEGGVGVRKETERAYENGNETCKNDLESDGEGKEKTQNVGNDNITKSKI